MAFALFCVKVKRPVAAAACVIAPIWVMLPLAVKFKSPVPTEEVPRLKAPPLTTETVLLPVLLKDTAPAKLLLLFVRRIALEPALKFAVPATVSAAVWPMPAPLAVAMAVKSLPMVDRAKFKVWVSVSVAEVPLVSETAPLRLLLVPLVVKSILLPAFKVVVPGTVSVPV